MPRKLTFNHVVIVLVWLVWLVIAIAPFTIEKIDESMLVTKYGQSQSTSCSGIQPVTGIQFEVRYQGEDESIIDTAYILCNQENADLLSYASIEKTDYKGNTFGLIANGNVLLDVSEQLESRYDRSIPIVEFFLCLFITWLMILRGRPLKNK